MPKPTCIILDGFSESRRCFGQVGVGFFMVLLLLLQKIAALNFVEAYGEGVISEKMVEAVLLYLSVNFVAKEKRETEQEQHPESDWDIHESTTTIESP